MDKNGWIVVVCIVFFASILFIANRFLSKKPSGGGLIKPETEAAVSDEVKNISAADVALDPKHFTSSFEKAYEVAKKTSPIFEGTEEVPVSEIWFAGMAVNKDEKYGYVMEFRVFSGREIKLTPLQLSTLLSIGEMYGVHVRLCEQEGMGVALKKDG
jgi:hypothetical protein